MNESTVLSSSRLLLETFGDITNPRPTPLYGVENGVFFFRGVLLILGDLPGGDCSDAEVHQKKYIFVLK
jgi:hypothetical protein